MNDDAIVPFSGGHRMRDNDNPIGIGTMFGLVTLSIAAFTFLLLANTDNIRDDIAALPREPAPQCAWDEELWTPHSGCIHHDSVDNEHTVPCPPYSYRESVSEWHPYMGIDGVVRIESIITCHPR